MSLTAYQGYPQANYIAATLTMGTITANAVTTTSITPQVTISGGTAPYTVQFSWSTTSGGSYTNLGSPVSVSMSGGTAVGTALTGLTQTTTYYFKAHGVDSLSATGDTGPTGIQTATSGGHVGVAGVVYTTDQYNGSIIYTYKKIG